MIAYVDQPPRIEPRGGGFLVTLTSGGEESTFMLTLHALTGTAERARLNVVEAQAKARLAALEGPVPFNRKGAR